MDTAGIIPYIFCVDAGATANWLTQHLGDVLGFRELGRWHNDDGVVTNVEIAVPGGGEIWLDGPVADWAEHRQALPAWTGFLVDDVNDLHDKLTRVGLEADQPRDRPFGAIELTVTDPEGHQWGFIQRIGST